jgi:UDP-N-acetyl-2-amino-2-deoxyglucuronate dehydrogenase
LAKGDLRVAVVGAGSAARKHLQAIKQLSDITAFVLVGRSESAVRKLAQEFAIPWTTSLAGALDEVDIVAICTPSGTHAEIGIQCVEAGRHVLIEKPLDASPHAARTLAIRAALAGVTLGCVFQLRTVSCYRYLFDLVSDGQLGRVELVSMVLPWYRPQAYYNGAPWRGSGELGGGVMLSQATHYLDVIVELARLQGAHEVRLHGIGRTSSIHTVPISTVAAGMMVFEPGPLVTLAASTAAVPGSGAELFVMGTRRQLRIQSERLVGEPETGERHGVPGSEAWTAVAHAAVYRDFADAVRSGRPPLVSGERAALVADIAQIMERPSETGSHLVHL